ncbi:ribonuclease HII [Haloarchaeobius sp. HME9146]|uniref:ribonuclease HII n=1 Tax=Haloarchaeobius sp. HME9146 TaxID=2978732 RepID=UPI0021C0BB0F|nr:ribonuclease HII [Haloarchaeobius sp. HME9146]MCT9097922.1 ribonuclease HII [Haloarchaeobius sp. HME9146]
MYFGVDEAGKGPVLGSMWAAAVVVPDDAVLPDDVDDSKRVQPARREEIATALRADDRVRIGLAEITPERIDDPETDMNTLTVLAHAEALEDAGVDGLSGYVDAGDTDEARFGRRVAGHCSCDIEVTAEHGADETYPVVAAASIVAKVERDAQMARLGEEYGAVGSGYPSDPTTREFLADYVAETGELPPFARASWSTSADVLAAHEQTGLGDF